MFIPKRWLVPTGLSLVLLAMVLAVGLAGFAPRSDQEGLGIASHDASLASAYTDPALCEQVVAQPAALTAQQQADVLAYLQALEASRTVVVTDAATNSGTITDSQFTDGGFGDIGLQWREVAVGAPITNIHISGTDNTTTIIVGDDNTVIIGEDPVTEAPVETITPEVVSTPAAPSAPPVEVVVTPTVEAPAAPVVEAPAAVEAPTA